MIHEILSAVAAALLWRSRLVAALLRMTSVVVVAGYLIPNARRVAVKEVTVTVSKGYRSNPA